MEREIENKGLESPGQEPASGFGILAARCALGGYRFLGRCAGPAVRAFLRRRVARGREDPQRLGERLGRAGQARPEGPLVWLHGASVGEAVSLLPLIERLRQDRPDLNLLVTSGTVTSAEMMAERLPAAVIHQYVPVDLPQAVSAFFAHWRPALGLMVESEFWPNLIRGAADAGCALVLLNGRVSPASYRKWRRFRPLIGALLGRFDLIMARTARDQTHLEGLGAQAVICPGDLKAAAPPLDAEPVALAAVAQMIGGRPCWLAASTHAGEERIVGAVHQALLRDHPGLLTLLVPRHPARGDEIRAELAGRGLTVAQRSRGETVSEDTDICLADTLGEMGLWYRLADLIFVGGSLVPIGGHNLLEPAKLDCAILTGPHMANFRQMSEEMAAAGALRQVADPEQLQASLAALLADPEARATLSKAAAAYASRQAGVLDRVIEALAPALTRAAARR